jgi:hypothetical protein
MPLTTDVIDQDDKKARAFLNRKVLTGRDWVASALTKDADSSGKTRMVWFGKRIERELGEPDEDVEVGIILNVGFPIRCDMVFTGDEAKMIAKLILMRATFHSSAYATGTPGMFERGVAGLSFWGQTADGLHWNVGRNLYGVSKALDGAWQVDQCISSGPFRWDWKPKVRGL